MKVVFKLTPAQLEIATGIKDDVTERERRLEKELEEYTPHGGKLGSHGNMLETTCSHPGLNQNFWLNLEGNLLSFEGERHPLQKDGALSVILEVFGSCEIAASAIVAYTTSDRRLAWHETLEDYLYHRGSLEEILQEIKKTPNKYVRVQMERFPEIQDCLFLMEKHGKENARVFASHNGDVVLTALAFLRENVIRH